MPFRIIIRCQIIAALSFCTLAEAKGPTVKAPYNDCFRTIQQIFSSPLIADLDVSQATEIAIYAPSQNVFEIKRVISNKYYLLEEVAEVVSWASKQMQRRGWTGSFLKERLAIAQKFSSTSRYLYTRSKLTKFSGQITGSMGMTMAEYVEGKRALERLPMEVSHGWRLERPLGFRGKGKIIELRTYGIDKNANGDPFQLLWHGLSRMLKEELEAYPELLHEKIIYTYGDELSLRMYRAMGLSLADQKLYPPIVHKGTKWMVLTGSPNDVFSALIPKIEKYTLTGLHGPIRVTVPGGKNFIAEGSSGIFMERKNALKFTFYEPSEVREGIWAEKGSKAEFYPSGNIRTVPVLEKDAFIPIQLDKSSLGFYAKQGTSVTFFEDGSVFHIKETYKSITLPGTQLRVPKGSELRFNQGGSAREIILGARTEVFPNQLPGIFAAKDTSISWNYDYQALRFYLDSETELMPGLFGAAKTHVCYFWDANGRFRLSTVTKISRPYKRGDKVIEAGGYLDMDRLFPSP